MIDLSTAKIGEKFITRNGVVVDYVHRQNRVYGSGAHTYITSEYTFSWNISPSKVKFLTVNQFGLEWPPFEGKWDIVKKIPNQDTICITIF